MGKYYSMFRIFVLSIVVCGQLYGASAMDSHTLSLDQVLAKALASSPTMAEARRNLELSGLTVEDAEANFLPSLSFDSSHSTGGQFNPMTGQEPTRSSSAGVNLSSNLFNNGKDVKTLESAEVGVALAKLAFDEAKAKLVLDVKTSFFNLSRSFAALQIQTQRHKTIELVFGRTSKAYTQGLKSKTDYLRLKNELQQSKLTLREATGSFQDMERSLRVTMGLSPLDPIKFQFLKVGNDSIKPLPESLPFAGHYVDRRLELQNRKSKIATDLVRRDLYPKVDLSVGGGYTTANYLSNDGYIGDKSRNWSVTLGMSYPLWDNGRGRRSMRRALIEEKNTASRAETTKHETLKTLEELLIRSRQTLEDFSIQEELLSGEKDSFAVVEKKYREGKLSYLDFDKGVNSLYSAQESYVTTYFELKTIEAQFEFHQGGVSP